jgi:Helix-turn-helix domain
MSFQSLAQVSTFCKSPLSDDPTLDLDTYDICLLWVLADFADKYGTHAFMCVKTIAKMMKCTMRQVQSRLAKAVKQERIKADQRPGRTTMYALIFPVDEDQSEPENQSNLTDEQYSSPPEQYSSNPIPYPEERKKESYRLNGEKREQVKDRLIGQKETKPHVETERYVAPVEDQVKWLRGRLAELEPGSMFHAQYTEDLQKLEVEYAQSIHNSEDYSEAQETLEEVTSEDIDQFIKESHVAYVSTKHVVFAK